MASAARAILAALALTSLGGCALQQTPRAAPTPSSTSGAPAGTPAAPASEPPSSPAAGPPPPGTTPVPGAAAAPSAASPSPARAAAGSTPRASAPKRPAPAAPAGPASAPAAPAAVPAAASPPLNLASLEERLRDTHAIGVFTKLSLKNQVDDLLAQFRDFYAGKGALTLAELRRSYELLLMKVVTLLQNDDPGLAGAVATSREAIWAILSNRTSFNNL